MDPEAWTSTDFGLRVVATDFVRVIFESECSVSTGYVLLGGRGFDIQNLII